MHLLSRRPYYAAAAYRLQPFEVKGLGTLGVDKDWRLAVDPEAIAEWSIDQIASVLEHELGHLLRSHAERADVAGVRDHEAFLFNLAADAEINDDLVGLPDVCLPGAPITPSALSLPDGQIAEWYYDELKHNQEKTNTSGSSRDRSWPSGQPDGHDCGSGAHGRRRAWENAPDAPAGLSSSEAAVVREMTRQAILTHMKSMGNVPSGLQRWARASSRPTLPWTAILAAHTRAALGSMSGMNDYTRSRPSRRAGVMYPVVPSSLHRPQPRVALIFDTSGSMSTEELNRATSELSGVFSAAGVARLAIVECDAAAHLREVRISDLRRLALRGGGGTDLRIAYDELGRMKRRPDVVVNFTDGGTPWHEAMPFPAKHIVCLTAGEVPTPKWATAMHIPRTAVGARI
jgi:predicted metal-dependent peptidase